MVKKLVLILFLGIFGIACSFATDKKFTLVIDAGHGGKDAGAIGANSQEKNINLAVALAFGRYVEQNCPDVKVIYTRKTDVFIELQERANIANRNKADLFVSVHTNAVERGNIVRGFQTYTLGMHRAADNLAVAKRENSVITLESNYSSKYQGFDPNSAESYIMFEYMQDKNMEKSVNLAKLIQSNVCAEASRINKGVHQAGFLVLRQTSMPSCLIELGFISTPDEEQQLNDASVQDNIARGIYNAFVQYVNKYGNGVHLSTAEVKRAVAAPQETKQTAKEEKTVEQAQKKVETVKLDTKVKDVPKAETPKAESTKKEEKPVPLAKKEGTTAVKKEDLATKQVTKVETPANKTDIVKKDVAGTKAEVEKKTETKKTVEQTKKAEPTKAEADKKVDTVKKAEPTKKTEATKSAETAKQTETKTAVASTSASPVFKVQILVSSKQMRANNDIFKGVDNVEHYEEGGQYKYTVGSSTDYNEISALRKKVASKFPEAFVVAFKNGVKMNVNEAIKEWKARK